MNELYQSGCKFVISLRVERPIEGCEMTPHASLYIKGGSIDNVTRAKMMESNPHQFSFQWRRGPKKSMCENPSCPRRELFEPIHWSKFTLGGPRLQCAICEKAGVPKHDSTFCSKACFQEYWKLHCENKHNPSFYRSVGRQKEENDLSLIEDQDCVSGSPILTSISSVDNQENEWLLIGSDRCYTPTAEDIGCIHSIEVKAFGIKDNIELCESLTVLTEPVLSYPKPPPKRQLLTIPGSSSGVSSGAIRFRVVSYNILAEMYATKQAYPYCDTWNLSWAYRWAVLLRELDEVQGDIICLQEVQSDHFEQNLNPSMKERGYDGIFKQKTRDSMGQYGKVDGCATFWKRSKFIMIENYAVEFNECARVTAEELSLDESDGRRYLNRLVKDNVAQITTLEALARYPSTGSNRSRQQLCVVNTHLYSNHQRPDVKLWQTLTLMREVEQFVVTRGDVALILCGDLNSEPHSAVYEYLVEGSVSRDHPDVDTSYHTGVWVLPDISTITHTLELASSMYTALGTEPMFTNFTANFRGTLDYVMYTPSRLKIMAASAIPEAADLEAEVGVGLPSPSYASDHIMLCCDVAFVVSGNGSVIKQTASNNKHHIQPVQSQNMSATKSKRGGSGGGSQSTPHR